MSNVNLNYRGSNGAKMSFNQSTVYAPRGSELDTKPATAPARIRLPRPELIAADPVRMMQVTSSVRVIPYAGWEGKIQPRIGYLIDLLKLEYVHVHTQAGDHLVILRNEGPLRDGTDTGTLHHFFVPAGSNAIYAAEGTVPGSKAEIQLGIENSEDDLTYGDASAELALALDVRTDILTRLTQSQWNTPAGEHAMISWHRDLICDGMNH